MATNSDILTNKDIDDHPTQNLYPPTEDGSQSYPGSVTYPYHRSLMNDAIFARCLLVANPNVGPETYISPLSMLGHGIPLWEPIGSLSYDRKKKHLQTGISIGDVGYLGRDGDFIYLFNIFSSANDDIQVECPPHFAPLPSPDPKEIIKSEMYFSPGTALVSKGVTVSHLASSPLDIEFTIDARESGILVLPNGASGEDLVSTDLVRDFVQENAMTWYMFINRQCDVICPNGHLYVITGCDKTATYSLATSSPWCLQFSDTPPTIRYQDGEWKGHERYHIVTAESDASFHTDKCAVILRGMHVALKESDWINYIFCNEPPLRMSFYYMLSLPVTGFRARWQTRREKRSVHMDKLSDGSSEQLIFSPSVVIVNLLIQECPNANVAIAEDKQWCSFTANSDGSVQQIARLLRKMLEENKISEQNGLATLVPMNSHSEEMPSGSQNILLRALKSFRAEYLARRRRAVMAMKIAKIFPGRGLPDDLLS